jgi:hypothetical protein
MLTTEALVSELPEEKKGAPMPGSHGGWGFFVVAILNPASSRCSAHSPAERGIWRVLTPVCAAARKIPRPAGESAGLRE